MTFTQRVLLNTALVLVSIGGALLLGEASIRVVQWVRDGTPLIKTASTVSHFAFTLDAERGWRATPHYRRQYIATNADGSTYPVSLSQDAHGFRLFGDLHASRPRILVIGDSFTHGREVSDSNTYAAILRDSLDAEVFAYGVMGYATLQEYMALTEYFALVKPDLIIWQYCPNDLINNSLALEMRSTLNNNGMRRPYLLNGKIEYVLPKPSTKLIREVANKYSRFLRFVIHRIDQLRAVPTTTTLEHDMETKGLAIPDFAEAVRVTDQIMGDMRHLIGTIPVLAYASQPGPVTQQVFADISRKHGIDFLMGLPDSLRAAQRRGMVLTAADRAHWNEAGHRMVAHLLLPAVRLRLHRHEPRDNP